MLNRLGFDNRFGRVAATYDMSPRGNGYLVPILPKTDFAFDGRLGTAPVGNQDVPVAVGVDSSSWVSGILAVRLHARNAWLAGNVLSVIVDNIMLAPEEPDVVFAASPSLATVTFNNGDNAPLLKTATLTGMGPMLRVMVRWHPGSANAFSATMAIGIDLVGRPA